MRSTFPTLILTFLFLLTLSILLSPISAQSTPTPTPQKNDPVSGDIDSMINCMKCLSKAGLSQVPTCSNLQDNPAISSVPVDKLNDIQRQCYCGLVSSTEWTKSCATAPKQLCNATIVDTFLLGFVHVKPHVCTTQVSGQKSAAVVVEVPMWVTLGALAVFTVLL